jgi:hypothetical protein
MQEMHEHFPLLVPVAARWSPFVVIFSAAMPPDVHQVAEQHEDRNRNEEPVVLQKLAHRNPPP